MPFWWPIPVVVAFLISTWLTPVIRRVALRFGVIDSPDGGRKLHAAPTPLLGGLASGHGDLAGHLELHHVHGRVGEVADHALDVAADVADLGVLGRLDLEEGRLHERGEAAPSLTILDGIPAIRAAIINHRTEERDIDAFTEFLDAALRRARKEPHDFGALIEPHGPGKTRLSED